MELKLMLPALSFSSLKVDHLMMNIGIKSWYQNSYTILRIGIILSRCPFFNYVLYGNRMRYCGHKKTACKTSGF